ncbi:YlaN family protein [Enterococcus sp. CSURQ0835]|uniref:YlaN family protein n=1 Tax=Enterococcus sp. CSURQ0835 TaxID=2681394 RepID=UPI0013589959|nr:YlaN family protein [Enterococcus sp. CSURQ0835]
MESVSSDFAIEVLKKDAQRIKMLIQNQHNSLCISQCKAFEEVVDTQMYGFSRQVFFAERIGLLTEEEGHQMLSDLEGDLNRLYTELYENRYESNESHKEA